MTQGFGIEGRCEPRFAKIREAFERSFTSGAEIGASVAITLDGVTVVELIGGHLDRERTQPWQPDTLANVYSTTKGMTAICAHQLVEQGVLDLDAPVASYWPEFAAAGKSELPVRMLLNHQAGLAAVRKALPEGASFDWDLMCSALAEQEPWWQPGTRHGYHALTYGYLVGEVVRRVSGRSLGAYFRENVAQPLGVDFHIGFGPELDARVAPLFGGLGGDAAEGAAAPEPPPGPLGEMMRAMRDPTTLTGAAFANPPLPPGTVNTRAWRAAEIPAANGHGTAAALARVYGALARGGEVDGVRVLGREAIQNATREQSFGPDAVLGGLPTRFGLGFMLRHDFMPLGPNAHTFGHPGAGGSVGFADPDARIGFGYVMNRMQATMMGGAGAYALISALYECLR